MITLSLTQDELDYVACALNLQLDHDDGMSEPRAEHGASALDKVLAAIAFEPPPGYNENPDSAQHVERVRRVIALTESRNNAPVVCADHPFLVEDLRALVGPDKAKQPCPSCGTERGKIRGIDPTFEVWDGEFCSQCGYMPKRQQNRTSAK